MKYIIYILSLLLATVRASPVALVDTKGRSISVEIISQQDDLVTFRKNDGKEYTVPLATLNEATRTAIIRELKANDEAKLNESMAESYQHAVGNIPRAKRTIKYFIGADIEIIKLLIQIQETFVKEYESRETDRKSAYTKYTNALTAVYDSKPVVGYNYNEILKTEIATPIEFNLYKNSDLFYIKVGDGNFCTVATVSPRQLLDLVIISDKIDAWIAQCIADKMDVTKEVGGFGGVNLELVSSDLGDNIYFLLTVKGEVGSDRILEKQTVRVSLLNWRCLYMKFSKVKEIYDKREQLKANAEKLK